MVGRPGGLTAKEQVFVEHFAATADATYSAEKAGYGSPANAGWRVLQRPEVLEAARSLVIQKLTLEGAPLATAHFIESLQSSSVSVRDKTQISMFVIKTVVGESVNALAGAKELHQMSRAELDQRIAQIQGEQASRAVQVIDADAAAPIDLFD